MTITKEELERLYMNNSNKFVCEKLGITNTTLITYLKKNGIKTKGRGYGMRGSTKLKKLTVI